MRVQTHTHTHIHTHTRIHTHTHTQVLYKSYLSCNRTTRTCISTLAAVVVLVYVTWVLSSSMAGRAVVVGVIGTQLVITTRLFSLHPNRHLTKVDTCTQTRTEPNLCGPSQVSNGTTHYRVGSSCNIHNTGNYTEFCVFSSFAEHF